MVNTEGTMGYSHLNTSRVGQFLSVDLSAHAPFQTSFEHAGRLFWRKKAFVTEHIDEIGKPLSAYLGNHLVDNKVYIVGLATSVGPSHGMGTEKR